MDGSLNAPELAMESSTTGAEPEVNDVSSPVTPQGAELAAEKTAEARKDLPKHPPYPALEWKVSEDLFYAAKKAALNSPESFWSYSLYRGPGEDGPDQKVKVHYCRSLHTTERVCKQYFMNEKVLGFDLEWVADSPRWANARRNVSLIQLASPSRIALFHVALFAKDEYVAPSFKKIMENSDITKVGVWIKGDATRLRNHLQIDSKGLMELSHLYKLVTYSRSKNYRSINKRLIPMAKQVEEYLHLPLFKGSDVRSSDWSKALNLDQVIYSASDAYAGVQLYAALEHARKQLDPCPPRPYHAELNRPIRLADGVDLDTDTEEELVEQPIEKDDKETPADGAEDPDAPKADLESASDCPAAAKDERVIKAETWVAAFKAENQVSDGTKTSSSTYATLSELRAYHVWHTNKDLDPSGVAQLLRKPPLKAGTVALYICNAVKKERLPVDRARYQKEVVKALPERLRWAGRWDTYP
jgi:exonuclease 3'-5' domain-containing protein 2